MNKKKIVGWIKEHKWQIAGTALAAAGIAGAYAIGKAAGSSANVVVEEADLPVNDIKSIVMDLVSDTDGSVQHFDILSGDRGIAGTIESVTDISATDAVKQAIDTMKETYPFYDYKKGFVRIEFLKPEGVEITNF